MASLISRTLVMAIFFVAASAAQGQVITGAHPEGLSTIPLGTAWRVFFNGEIKLDSAAKLEAFLRDNKVPAESSIVFNSPGGNLYAGMEIGRLVRKYRLRTDVGIQESPNQMGYVAGGCYSACSLAYIGGRFRFLQKASHFGIHRFSFTKPIKGETDISQITSAQIVAYLREMGIDTAFYTLSTKAGADGMLEPPRNVLEQLNVLNYGFEKANWSIESLAGGLYVKGQRETEYGINKFILYCTKKQPELYIIIDPQGHENELLHILNANSLVIDGTLTPIQPTSRKMKNGWLNATYSLSAVLANSIRRARSVGVVFQARYGAPIFLGFDSMPTGEDGRRKIDGILSSCGI
ncbi:MAG: hypothetical protein J0I08_22870 [Rhizobiales bacterium]|nr:hypothetical protein [Hyphomicrobiales bacterium]